MAKPTTKGTTPKGRSKSSTAKNPRSTGVNSSEAPEKVATDSVNTGPTGGSSKELPENFEDMVRKQLGDDAIIIKNEADIPDDIPDEVIEEIKAALKEDGCVVMQKKSSSLFGEEDDMPSFAEFLRDSGLGNLFGGPDEDGKDDCQCPGCKRRRGEKVDPNADDPFGDFANFLNQVIEKGSDSFLDFLESVLPDEEDDDSIGQKHKDDDRVLIKKFMSDIYKSRHENGDGLPSEISLTLEIVEDDGHISKHTVTGTTM